MDDQEHVDRIAERLRKDHPDPKQRAEMYAEAGRMATYVRTLMNGQDADDAAIERIARAVEAADDLAPEA